MLRDGLAVVVLGEDLLVLEVGVAGGRAGAAVAVDVDTDSDADADGDDEENDK